MAKVGGPPEEWPSLSFKRAVKRLQSGGGRIPASDYRSSGALPVIDQGQRLIAGYTDNVAARFQGLLPIVIFGDHTRNVKFIDFDFAVGSQGTVILRPVDDIDPRFFAYWLQSLPLHNLGYSRHYKLLAELTVPVPPLPEQWRIVARVEALTSRADETGRLSMARETELDFLLKATYSRIIEDVEWRPLNTVASLVRRGIKVLPDENYEEMGIRSFGKGTFKKPVLTGQQIGNKRIYRIHQGDLVFMNVFAWEGAIAVAQAEDDGRVGSHRFITYVPHEGKATSEFLCHHFLSERGLEDIRAASPGSAGRNRTLGLAKLANISVPVPDYEAQLRFEEIARRRREIRRIAAGVGKEMTAYHAAVLAKAFRGEL